jgi:hypothetical protein
VKSDFKKSSPLKPLGQMNRNLAGSIYGMSSMTIAHFVPSTSTSTSLQPPSITDDTATLVHMPILNLISVSEEKIF